MQEFLRNLLIYVFFYQCCLFSFVNYMMFHELCDRMRFDLRWIARNRGLDYQNIEGLEEAAEIEPREIAPSRNIRRPVYPE